ncbi:nucleoside-diphosphate kinase [Desulfohalobium retbaense]|uniref:Nucleoside diphosphate kinase n=1 Tax=Desulfohalobium retbaense (strain ATCC 49708 / DSM 5692 / JCM 16813 / HR100) TaxID=485915 RepID=C8X4V1_DESRD|nr:nucleoside-diphosphate kinase [Desulfohalobium retbaense]ACV69448.1 Nucleoside-diphosphate kinase [Desulfohalobium retbaense DSM 5692]
MTQQTLSIIKPDAVERGLTGTILARIQDAGLRLVALKMLHLDTTEAEAFYAVHKDKPFFGSLTSYMSSGPIVVAVLEGENAISRYRDLMGATNPEKAAEGTLRKTFAVDLERNSVHGSDAPETAATEIAYFFNQLELVG